MYIYREKEVYIYKEKKEKVFLVLLPSIVSWLPLSLIIADKWLWLYSLFTNKYMKKFKRRRIEERLGKSKKLDFNSTNLQTRGFQRLLCQI